MQTGLTPRPEPVLRSSGGSTVRNPRGAGWAGQFAAAGLPAEQITKKVAWPEPHPTSFSDCGVAKTSRLRSRPESAPRATVLHYSTLFLSRRSFNVRVRISDSLAGASPAATVSL